MKFLLDTKNYIYARENTATPYEIETYICSSEFVIDPISGARLIDEIGCPIYMISEDGASVTRIVEFDEALISKVKNYIRDNAKAYTNNVMSHTDYFEIKQLDPDEPDKLSETELTSIRESRRGIRELYRNFKTDLENAVTRSQCVMLYRTFVNQVDACE